MDEIIEENVAKQTAYLLGEQSGIEQGIEQGIQEKQNEVVLNMHNNNLSIQMIATCTNLTNEEVEDIINNNKD